MKTPSMSAEKILKSILSRRKALNQKKSPPQKHKTTLLRQEIRRLLEHVESLMREVVRESSTIRQYLRDNATSLALDPRTSARSFLTVHSPRKRYRAMCNFYLNGLVELSICTKGFETKHWKNLDLVLVLPHGVQESAALEDSSNYQELQEAIVKLSTKRRIIKLFADQILPTKN